MVCPHDAPCTTWIVFSTGVFPNNASPLETKLGRTAVPYAGTHRLMCDRHLYAVRFEFDEAAKLISSHPTGGPIHKMSISRDKRVMCLLKDAGMLEFMDVSSMALIGRLNTAEYGMCM